MLITNKEETICIGGSCRGIDPGSFAAFAFYEEKAGGAGGRDRKTRSTDL